MTQIAVAVVNYNTRDLLRACLASVLAEEPVEVLVVDNASSDGSVEMVKAEYPEVRLYANKANSGYGSAANQAVAACPAKYILLLNSDTLLHRGTLSALGGYLDLHPEAAIVGPRLVNPDNTVQASCHTHSTPLNTLLEHTSLSPLIGYIPVIRNRYLPAWSHDHTRIVTWIKGAALAIRREAFTNVGGFDDSFFMYFEEADLCYRLNAAGWQVHFTPIASVQHVGGASTMQVRGEMAVRLYMSSIQFFERHYSGLRLLGLLATMKTIVLTRLVVDSIRFYLTWDLSKRAAMETNVVAWQRALRGDRYHGVPRS